jgi:hypothetical protein
MNADDKARTDLAHSIRLLALALNRLATEIERPVRERPFYPVGDVALANEGVEHWESMLDADPLTNEIEAASKLDRYGIISKESEKVRLALHEK